MGLSGLEPPTSRLSGVRSNRLSYKPKSSILLLLSFGTFVPNGDGEIRTHDPLLARQVLSQLSYTPKALPRCLEETQFLPKKSFAFLL